MTKSKKILAGLFLIVCSASNVLGARGNLDEVDSMMDEFEINKNASVVSDIPRYTEYISSPSNSSSEVLGSPQIKVASTNKMVIDSLELRDMDIKDVLKLISEKTGLNIVAGGNINGRVTLFMQDVPVNELLRIILVSNDLAYAEDEGLIRVMPAADYERIYGHKFGTDMETKVMYLQSVKPSEVLSLLSQIKSPEGKVVVDDQSNTVMISDNAAKIAEMEDYIRKIDVPTITRVYSLHYIQAEVLSAKIAELLTPKLGTLKFDVRSNKLFVKDTLEKLEEVTMFISEIDVPRATGVYDISYAKAEDVAKVVTKVLTEGVGTIEFDARSNKIIVTDTAAKIAEAERIVKALDKKEKEVLIEARIVQIVLEDEFRMGVDWEALIPELHDLALKSEFGDLGPDVPRQGTLSVGTLNEDNYAVVVEALETLGQTQLLSNPRIAVVNNEEAKILVGTNQPYVTTTTTTPSSGPAVTAEAVNFIDVGVKLFVTPTIHNDGFVTMKIKPEVSSAAQTITTGTANEIPIVDTSEAETTIRVKDGVTIIIGGLIKDERINRERHVPILGRIPLLGLLFKNIDKSTEKSEIVIFLTPKIITGDVHSEYTLPFDARPSQFEQTSLKKR